MPFFLGSYNEAIATSCLNIAVALKEGHPVQIYMCTYLERFFSVTSQKNQRSQVNSCSAVENGALNKGK